MTEPTDKFLRELAYALKRSEHRNVAEHLAAGLLWAMYPEWFEKVWAIRARQEKRSGK